MINHDKYSHPVPGIQYIKESILGPGGNSDEFYTWFETTCSCVEQSLCISECDCIKRFGRSYINGLLTTEKLKNEYCAYECSAFCSCGEFCSNKVVQSGPNPYLEIRQAGKKGLGVFTLKSLEAGSFISEYAGQIISKEVAEQQYKVDQNNKYILVMREHYDGNIVETCFDAYTCGNISRYINHSCSPNCIIIPVRTGCLVPKAGIFSTRLIEKNEEISYSYYQGSSGLSRSKCYCHSAICKGFLPSTIDIS